MQHKKTSSQVNKLKIVFEAVVYLLVTIVLVGAIIAISTPVGMQ